MSNWTELDIWQYIKEREIEVVPLYYAKKRPVIERNGTKIMVDDERMPEELRKTAKKEPIKPSHSLLNPSQIFLLTLITY